MVCLQPQRPQGITHRLNDAIKIARNCQKRFNGLTFVEIISIAGSSSCHQ